MDDEKGYAMWEATPEEMETWEFDDNGDVIMPKGIEVHIRWWYPAWVVGWLTARAIRKDRNGND